MHRIPHRQKNSQPSILPVFLSSETSQCEYRIETGVRLQSIQTEAKGNKETVKKMTAIEKQRSKFTNTSAYI